MNKRNDKLEEYYNINYENALEIGCGKPTVVKIVNEKGSDVKCSCANRQPRELAPRKELTPLEALEILTYIALESDCERIQSHWSYTPLELKEIIETALKAFEIIKEKVGIHWNELLQLWLKTKLINKEEYDLLKEVLK